MWRLLCLKADGPSRCEADEQLRHWQGSGRERSTAPLLRTSVAARVACGANLLTVAVCLGIGVIVMPCLIFAVGRMALGPYAHGSVFALWRDFMHRPGCRVAGGAGSSPSGRTCSCGCCAAAAACYITEPTARCDVIAVTDPAAPRPLPRGSRAMLMLGKDRARHARQLDVTHGESTRQSLANPRLGAARSRVRAHEVVEEIALALVTNARRRQRSRATRRFRSLRQPAGRCPARCLGPAATRLTSAPPCAGPRAAAPGLQGQ